MHVLSNEVFLVITAVLDIAIHGRDTPARSDEVASRVGLSRHALEPALRSLSRRGIVMRPDGAGGGYRLARDACKISVADILRATGFLEPCNGELDNPILIRATDLPALLEAGRAFAKRTSTISLADLVRAAASQGSLNGL
jgi:Rrf2 family transcriptional regulator, iron-sulfur cluster assembly transcription factor